MQKISSSVRQSLRTSANAIVQGEIKMRAVTIAALLAAAPAFAQEPPTTIKVGVQYNGAFEAAGDIDTFRIKLVQGQDYAVGITAGVSDSWWTLRGPTGTVLDADVSGLGESGGFEFRAGRTGYFTVEGREDAGASDSVYTLRFYPDCLGSVKTRCQIKPGATQSHTLAHGAKETDFVRLTNLKPGRTYTMKLITPPSGAELSIIKGAATVAQGGIFKAGTGTYYAMVTNDNVYNGSGPYKLSLR
jgi:hypothetical protein